MTTIHTIEEAKKEMGLKRGSSVEELDSPSVFDGKMSALLLGLHDADVYTQADDVVQIILKKMFEAYLAAGEEDAAIHIAKAAEHIEEAVCLQIAPDEPESPDNVIRFQQ